MITISLNASCRTLSQDTQHSLDSQHQHKRFVSIWLSTREGTSVHSYDATQLNVSLFLATSLTNLASQQTDGRLVGLDFVTKQVKISRAIACAGPVSHAHMIDPSSMPAADKLVRLPFIWHEFEHQLFLRIVQDTLSGSVSEWRG